MWVPLPIASHVQNVNSQCSGQDWREGRRQKAFKISGYRGQTDNCAFDCNCLCYLGSRNRFLAHWLALGSIYEWPQSSLDHRRVLCYPGISFIFPQSIRRAVQRQCSPESGNQTCCQHLDVFLVTENVLDSVCDITSAGELHRVDIGSRCLRTYHWWWCAVLENVLRRCTMEKLLWYGILQYFMT